MTFFLSRRTRTKLYDPNKKLAVHEERYRREAPKLTIKEDVNEYVDRVLGRTHNLHPPAFLSSLLSLLPKFPGRHPFVTY